MKKNIVIILISFCVILVALAGMIYFFTYLQKPQSTVPQNTSEASDSEIISLLNKNQDTEDYMQNYKDFKIDKKTVLTKESIIEGQNGQNFKEVYQNLELTDNRYMKVDLMNLAGDRGMITVIDLKEKQVLKAFGTVLFKTNADQNGKAGS